MRTSITLNINFILLIALSFTSLSANSYIGPGLGLGTIGVVLGILLAILLALFSILWYPVKRLIQKINKKPSPMEESKTGSSSK